MDWAELWQQSVFVECQRCKGLRLPAGPDSRPLDPGKLAYGHAGHELAGRIAQRAQRDICIARHQRAQVLRHRTQILYIADISMVCTYLQLAPGCVVLESGTGSGALTHSLIRAVAPTGHVHTFEFHPTRASELAAGLRGFVCACTRVASVSATCHEQHNRTPVRVAKCLCARQLHALVQARRPRSLRSMGCRRV